GHEAAENAGFVHPPQHRLRIAPPGQDLEEQRVGARVAAHVFLDQFGVAPSHAHRLGMDLEAFLLGNLKQLDEAYRVLPEPLRARSTDLAGCDLISFEQPRPTAEAGEQTRSEEHTSE